MLWFGMSDSRVTVCVANLGVKDAFDLMWKSFCKHHGEYPLYVWDNGSKDGCDSLGRMYATKYREGNESHGVSLDRLCRMVETEYVLVSDNDVEYLAPVVDDMIAEDAFCVCPPERFGQGSAEFMGFQCEGQPRIDPCCALFRTDELKELLQFASFAFYVSPHQNRHYDTGSMLYHFARAVGKSIKTPGWLWERIYHYGTLTWGLGSPEGSNERVLAESRYTTVRGRLAEYREV